MISNELMMALIKYHVLDMKDNEEINNLIISGKIYVLTIYKINDILNIPKVKRFIK